MTRCWTSPAWSETCRSALAGGAATSISIPGLPSPGACAPKASGAGSDCGCGQCAPAAPTFASEMTKWFDTNYHYIVPEFQAEGPRSSFSSERRSLTNSPKALALGIRTKPGLIGPVTYLDARQTPRPGASRFRPVLSPGGVAAGLCPGASPPAGPRGRMGPNRRADLFHGPDGPATKAALAATYATLAAAAPKIRILVASYFGGLRDNLDAFVQLPVGALHLDLVRAPEDLARALPHLTPRQGTCRSESWMGAICGATTRR